MPFRREICLDRIGFSYAGKGLSVLRGLSLRINRGSRVGFIGTTGSGKSTLLDLIMGLLTPTEGSLNIDGQTVDSENCRSWQRHIAHVPQHIFLVDATIAENIAFGIPLAEIDFDRVRTAAQHARIADTIESWRSQYDTTVGERGVRLSGGQRQRIGIARALYKRVDVLILDEATSALDNDTERAVMESIEAYGDSLTVLIVAHRLSTLKNCTQIVELDNGKIRRIGSYEEIIESKETSESIKAT
jgi:ATP-binding cassette subfamily B protein